jgi:RNA polymerase sigma-70 factor (sigma-E family)
MPESIDGTTGRGGDVVGSTPRDEEFARYYIARGDIMRKTAYLLCGDWHLAEDLTQTTFVRLYQVWRRVNRRDVLDQYTRQVLFRVFLDERRRPWRREKSTVDVTPPDGPAPHIGVADQIAVRMAMAGVPPRQRATLVCRFWLDMSVEDTADVLGCSPGTVKSQTARGLAKLRVSLGPLREPLEETIGESR